MSRPLNPARITIGDGEGASRKSGRRATAGSVNGLILPLAHVAGRIVPIHNMRPTDRPTDDSEGATVDTWTVPYYPTHGHWREDDEDAIDGVIQTFGGVVHPQFGNAFTVDMTARLQHPNAPALGASPYYDTDIDCTWDETSTTATGSADVALKFRVAREPYGDPDEILDPVALSARYGDVGPFNLTCRDAIDCALVMMRDLSKPLTVQTGVTDSEAFDTDSALEAEFDLESIGDSTGTARLYVGALTVYGITSNDADTSPDASTGDTVIPGVFPFTQRLGGGHPRSGQVLSEVVRDVIHAERTCYADRFQTLLSHRRPDATTGPLRAYKSTSDTNWTCAVHGATFRLPDALPGSANVTTTNSGSTAATRGALKARIWGKDLEVDVTVRAVSIAGSYGQSTTYASPTGASDSDTSGNWVRLDLDLLLPSGVAPGDDIDIQIWWRAAANGTDGYLSGWQVYEPPLTTSD